MTKRLRYPLLLALLATLPAWAQQPPPDAGRLLEETRQPPRPVLPPAQPPKVIDAPPVRPAITVPEGMAVTVSDFRITGAVSFPAATLAELVQPWVGRKLDINGLNEAAGAITRWYQRAGHLLTYAYLPAQRVADGVIEIAVLEGRIDGAQVVTAQEVRLRDEVIQAHTEPLAEKTPVVEADVERKLLLLNDIQGVTARGAFTPGASTGAAGLVVSVAEDEPLVFRAEFNNHGSRSTGVYRAGATVQLRDLFGWGDFTTLRALTSNRGSLVSGGIASSVPVGGDGYRIGASVSRLKYQLADQFKALGAVGTADSFGVDASYPFVRSASTNLGLRLGAEYKRLHDEAVVLPSTVAGADRPKRSHSADLGITFDERDGLFGGGVSAGSVTATMGTLRLLNPTERDADAASLNTAGTWRKLGAQWLRQQAIVGPFSANLRLAAQLSGRNLDSSEKFALGGPYAVRAYGPGEAIVDQGALASLDLRYGFDYLGGGLTVALFFDYAEGRINRRPLVAAGNDVKLSGPGLAVQWNGGDISLSASLAARTSRTATDGPDLRPRLYLQLVVTP